MPLKSAERTSVAETNNENNVPGITVNVSPPDSGRHNKTRRIGWKGRTAMVGAALLAAGAADLFIPRGEVTTTKITKAETTKVYPSTLNTRAIVEGRIRAEAKEQPGNDIGDHILNDIWGLGWVNEHINSSLGLTSTLTGPNGNGGGELATFVSVQSKYENIMPEKNGKVIVDIDASHIVLTTGINESQSEVIENNGLAASWGTSIDKSIPGTGSNLQARDENKQGQLDQNVRIAAVNEMQQRCIPAAWYVVNQAIHSAEVTVAMNDNKLERAAGANLLPLHSSDIIVNITGTPHYPQAYKPLSTNEQLTLSGNVRGGCEVAPHALNTSAGFVNANLDPLTS